MKSRPLALLGATFVVLLNLGRLAAGAVDLVARPAPRRAQRPEAQEAGPPRGRADPDDRAWSFLGFTFIPWLSAGRPAGGNLAERLRAGAKSLEKDIEGEVDHVVEKAGKIDVEKLGRRPSESSRDSPRIRRENGGP